MIIRYIQVLILLKFISFKFFSNPLNKILGVATGNVMPKFIEILIFKPQMYHPREEQNEKWSNIINFVD